MSATVEAFTSWLKSQVGTTESPAGSNRQVYAAIAGHPNGQPWCATFLAAGAKTVGLDVPSYSAYTPTLATAFRNAGAWHDTPQVGDYVFYDFAGGHDRIEHVGGVIGISADAIQTVEGNTSAGNNTNGGQVQARTRKRDRSIVGYGRPAYATPAPHPLRRPTMFLAEPAGAPGVYLCTIVAGNKVSSVGIEDPADRDRLIAAGVPLIQVTASTWKGWTE